MRRFHTSLLILMLMIAAVGCDSGDNDQSDAEIFIGTWDLANLLLNGQDFTAALFLAAAITSVEIDFEEDGSFTIRISSVTRIPERAGSYSLNESQNIVTLTSSDFVAPIALSYQIDSSNRIVLDTDDIALLVELSGVDPAGLPSVQQVQLVLQRVS